LTFLATQHAANWPVALYDATDTRGIGLFI